MILGGIFLVCACFPIVSTQAGEQTRPPGAVGSGADPFVSKALSTIFDSVSSIVEKALSLTRGNDVNNTLAAPEHAGKQPDSTTAGSQPSTTTTTAQASTGSTLTRGFDASSPPSFMTREVNNDVSISSDPSSAAFTVPSTEELTTAASTEAKTTAMFTDTSIAPTSSSQEQSGAAAATSEIPSEMTTTIDDTTPLDTTATSMTTSELSSEPALTSELYNDEITASTEFPLPTSEAWSSDLDSSTTSLAPWTYPSETTTAKSDEARLAAAGAYTTKLASTSLSTGNAAPLALPASVSRIDPSLAAQIAPGIPPNQKYVVYVVNYQPPSPVNGYLDRNASSVWPHRFVNVYPGRHLPPAVSVFLTGVKGQQRVLAAQPPLPPVVPAVPSTSAPPAWYGESPRERPPQAYYSGVPSAAADDKRKPGTPQPSDAGAASSSKKPSKRTEIARPIPRDPEARLTFFINLLDEMIASRLLGLDPWEKHKRRQEALERRRQAQQKVEKQVSVPTVPPPQVVYPMPVNALSPAGVPAIPGGVFMPRLLQAPLVYPVPFATSAPPSMQAIPGKGVQAIPVPGVQVIPGLGAQAIPMPGVQVIPGLGAQAIPMPGVQVIPGLGAQAIPMPGVQANAGGVFMPRLIQTASGPVQMLGLPTEADQRQHFLQIVPRQNVVGNAIPESAAGPQTIFLPPRQNSLLQLFQTLANFGRRVSQTTQ